jgi:phosphoglycolate phosphatase
MLLALFDVDGTLISTGGAGMRAFYRALNAIFNVHVEGEVLKPDGMTDPLIVKELIEHFDLTDRWCDKTRKDLYCAYLDYLEEEMLQARKSGLIRVLPGVENLLEMMSAQPDFCLGLVTGNLKQGACIKLQNAELTEYFRFGGYGSDSQDRTILTRIGIRRGVRVVAPEPVNGAFVIGDTPLDVRHGRAAGAGVIAVASARYGMKDLGLHKPDLLLPDLKKAESIIKFMRGNYRPIPEPPGFW